MSPHPDRAFVVESTEAGWRLDAWLAAALGASRSAVRRCLDGGRVRVDGRAVGLGDKGQPVVEGARVEVSAWTDPADLMPVPEPEAPLAVLDEGPGWVAVDKPAGQPVHPLAEGEGGTALNALVARHPEIVGVGEGGLRCGVVHRLDVDTSGVLLFATEEERFAMLRRAFRRHRARKTYRAWAAGSLSGEGHCVVHLAVGRHRPAKVRVVAEGDEPAPPGSRRTELSWRALGEDAARGATLVEVKPVTGFLHQIRVTLAHLGHPLLGDRTYASEALAAAAPRHLLHAAHIRIADVEAASPDPADFAPEPNGSGTAIGQVGPEDA